MIYWNVSARKFLELEVHVFTHKIVRLIIDIDVIEKYTNARKDSYE